MDESTRARSTGPDHPASPERRDVLKA
ncbi:MAG: hypothetical protein RL322_1773, partial [Pseudomonadota bacterium]